MPAVHDTWKWDWLQVFFYPNRRKMEKISVFLFYLMNKRTE